ncbi:hypothetical protein scyTo_0022253, partial [Scyliorhinus torazame]|nr:hypothetical protein [Scyliorhinus torazame]
QPIIGNLLYYRYMNPAIVAPDAFDIIDISAGGGGLTTDQRRNLGSIAKVLQHAASSKLFDKENCHLGSVNDYLSQAHMKFREATPDGALFSQDTDHQRAMQRRTIRDAKTPEKMKRDQVQSEENQMSLKEKKERIEQSLKKLATLGKVNPQNKYQDLINDVAKDIRNQRRYRQRRKAELVRLQQTYSGLISKTAFFEEQIDYYNQYIKTCMDNLASKGKFKNVIFDICPTEEVGDFEVKAKFMGVQMDSFMLHYQ